MAEKSELLIRGGFGPTWAETTVLAVHPEEEDADGRFERTFLLGTSGAATSVVDVLQDSVETAWYSSGSGTAYCPAAAGRVLLCRGGQWSHEQVCTQDETFVRVWGIAGASPEEDTVYIQSDENLFVRVGGSWTAYPFPDFAEEAMAPHGLTPDEIYLASPRGPVLFDGKGFHALEGPSGQLWVLHALNSETVLAVTTTKLWLSDESGGWKALESPSGDFSASTVRLGSDVYIASWEGVLRLREGLVEWGPRFECVRLVELGDAVVAASCDEGAYVLLDDEWSPLALPELAVGEVPR